LPQIKGGPNDPAFFSFVPGQNPQAGAPAIVNYVVHMTNFTGTKRVSHVPSLAIVIRTIDANFGSGRIVEIFAPISGTSRSDRDVQRSSSTGSFVHGAKIRLHRAKHSDEVRNGSNQRA
jgi:hypothetical protein